MKLFFFVMFFLIPIFSEGNINIILEGLHSHIENSIRKQLSYIQYHSKYVDLNIQNQISNIIKFNLKALGYYEPKIDIILPINSVDNKKIDTLIVKIILGNPVTIVKINVDIFGDGKYDLDCQQIIKDSQFFIGKILNHNDYEQFKIKIYNLALSKGYLDAKFQTNQLIVIPSLYQCIWDIHLYTGKRYFIESVNFQGSHIQENYLKNISNISLGEFYNTVSIIELHRRLSATNWFESIFISSDPITCLQKKNWY